MPFHNGPSSFFYRSLHDILAIEIQSALLDGIFSSLYSTALASKDFQSTIEFKRNRFF